MAITHNDRLRRRARSNLNRLIKEQNNKCLFCNSEIIRLKSLKGIIYQNAKIVIYKTKNSIEKKRIATIEHIKPLKFGGNNGQHNLVASCYSCNLLREFLVKHNNYDIVKVRLKLKKWFNLETDLQEFEFKFVHYCLSQNFGERTLKLGSDFIYHIYGHNYLIKNKGIYKIN